MPTIKPRHLETTLLDSLRHFPVVLLVGARQVGKSTLVQAIAEKSWPARYLTLDDRTVLDAALRDPDGFVQEAPRPVIIDEVQRAGDLLRAVKLEVDRRRRPGTFLLTGSANILTLSKVSETLAGRVAVHQLEPFSWTELEQKPPCDILDALFAADSAGKLLRRLPNSSPPGRLGQIRKLILTGGYPIPALMRSVAARNTWFDSYRQTYLERDLRQLADVANLPDFGRLLTTLALRTATTLNFSELSRDLGLPLTTLRRYFNILTQTYQVFLLRPYFANVGKRLVKTPKVYLTDSGLAGHLTATDSWETLDRQNRAGAMVETWVANELRKMLSVTSRRTELWYWRTQSGSEVDFLIQRGGQVVGIEVKSSRKVERKDLAGLRTCAEALGKSWRFGLLLHGGTEAMAIDKQTLALPFGVFLGREG